MSDLRRAFVAEHALIPSVAGKAVGLFARVAGALGRRPD